MSASKKKLLQTVAVDIGCSCGRPKLSTIFWPKSKPKTFLHNHKHANHSKHYHSSSSSLEANEDEDTNSNSNTTFSPKFDSTPFFSESEESSKTIKGFSKIGESIAVVKETNDPYMDFRSSMLSMIMEKEIYDREDLRELLNCFLSLNSPYHHEIILRVFREICNGPGHGQGYSWNGKKGT